MRNMLGEVRGNHLVQFTGGVLVHKGVVVVGRVGVIVAGAG